MLLGGPGRFVETESEAGSAETDEQNKKIRGIEHENQCNKEILSQALRNVKRFSVVPLLRLSLFP